MLTYIIHMQAQWFDTEPDDGSENSIQMNAVVTECEDMLAALHTAHTKVHQFYPVEAGYYYQQYTITCLEELGFEYDKLVTAIQKNIERELNAL